MLSNENIREELEEYINERGVKKTHIARAIDVSPNTVGLFLKGLRELSQPKLEIIYNIINS